MTTAASRTHTRPTTRTPPSPRRTVRVLQGATAVALAIAATVVVTDRVELGADTPGAATSAAVDAFPVDEQTALDRLVALGYLASPVADPEAEATARWIARGQVPAGPAVDAEAEATARWVARGMIPTARAVEVVPPDATARTTRDLVARGLVPAAALETHEQQVTDDLVARGLVPRGSSR